MFIGLWRRVWLLIRCVQVVKNKEVYEKLIASKDEQIEFLKGLLEKK